MARESVEMAKKLIEIYEDIRIRKRYYLSREDFKRIAGKEQLRKAYLEEVDRYLRENGYVLINLRDERDKIAVIKIKTILRNWAKVPDDIVAEYEWQDWIEEE